MNMKSPKSPESPNISKPNLVPLPLDEGSGTRNRRPNIWAINGTSELDLPSSAGCARSTLADGICCKELRKEERTLIDPDVVRDVVIGLSDGLTVPFALAAGLSSLGTSKIVVLGGIAELMAGAISMGIGGFFASQAERDYCRYQKYSLSQRVGNSCVSQLEREVSEVLGPVGVDKRTCRIVTGCLREVEERNLHQPGPSSGLPLDIERVSLSQSGGGGLTAFLLKFSLGLEEIPDRRMYTSAFTIGMGYLFGGIIPLIPYFFIPHAYDALVYSSIITGIVLLIFGAVKARVTGAARKPADYVWGAVSTLMVGGLAAAAAFGIVRSLEPKPKAFPPPPRK